MEKNIRNKKLNKKYNLLITAIPFIPIIKRFEKKIKKRGINYTLLKSSQQVSEKQFLKIIHKYDAILSGDDEITKKVIDKAINLKVISKWGTGIDSIEHEYAKKKGIKVFNTPGAFTNGVATMAISMILAFYESNLLKLNSIKAKKKLNWKCILTFRETINLVITWYKAFYGKKLDMENVSIDQIRFYEKIFVKRIK